MGGPQATPLPCLGSGQWGPTYQCSGGRVEASWGSLGSLEDRQGAGCRRCWGLPSCPVSFRNPRSPTGKQCVCGGGGSSSRSPKFLGCPQQSLSSGTANILQRTLGPGQLPAGRVLMPRWSPQRLPPPHTRASAPRRGSGPWVPSPGTWALQPMLDVVEGSQRCLLLGLCPTVGGARRADHPIQLHRHGEGQAGVWGRRG